MTQAYMKDGHGGAGDYGVQAQCVDCHLDHSNSAAYLLDKAKTGTHDIWVEYTQDTHAIDWEAKREERESFTYDNGCKHCHVELQEATIASPDAFIAHKAYYLGESSDTCVSCHPNVGHENLGEELLKYEERYQREQLKEQQKEEEASSGS
jgi:cytochrome c-type protein NapC